MQGRQPARNTVRHRESIWGVSQFGTYPNIESSRHKIYLPVFRLDVVLPAAVYPENEFLGGHHYDM